MDCAYKNDYLLFHEYIKNFSVGNCQAGFYDTKKMKACNTKIILCFRKISRILVMKNVICGSFHAMKDNLRFTKISGILVLEIVKLNFVSLMILKNIVFHFKKMSRTLMLQAVRLNF